MANEDAVRRLAQMDFEKSDCRDRLAIHTAIDALGQIEEVKRLCITACNLIDKRLSYGEWNDTARGHSDAQKSVIRKLNGDPAELKKLAGEE